MYGKVGIKKPACAGFFPQNQNDQVTLNAGLVVDLIIHTSGKLDLLQIPSLLAGKSALNSYR